MAPRKRKIKVVVPVSSPDKAKFSVAVIQTILNAQENETSHAKLIKELKNIYPSVAHESFMKSYIQSLKGAMQHDETNEYANNRLKLCAKFIADPDHSEQDITHPIIITAFDWLLNTISPAAIVRFRICQFVNLVLNAMGPEASLDDDICDKILRYMLERMRDVAPNVRVQAVLALQRLQNPDDPEDCVFRTYIYHLDTDPSPKVRQTIISSLGRNYRTIPYIIERLWDVEERVRRHTYLQMSSYPVKQYKVAQRLTFLEQGLNDHSEAVRKVVKNVMIPQWFESYQKDYVAFVKALKIDADEKELKRFRTTGKLALFEIFSKYGIADAMTMLGMREDDKTVPLENLTIETAVCWQALLEFLQKTESDELDSLMVDLSTFCNYIKVFAETPTACNYIRLLAEDPSMITDKLQKMYFQSMLQILLEIVDSYDFGDEFGRETLKKILAEVLCCCELDEDNVKIILSIFERLIGDVETRFKFFVDLVNSVLEPSRTDVSNSSRSLVEEYLEKNPDKSLQMKISRLRLTIMDLKEQEMEKVNRKDYAGAQKVAEELNVANEEYATLLKPILLEVSSTSEGSSLFRESMLRSKKITNATINKCLQISFYLVNSSTVQSLTPIVCDLYKTFINRYVESAEIATRDWALRCSVAFSMLYDGLSKETFQLLYHQFFRNHCTRIWQTSIEGIFELMDHYGFEHFDVESKKDESRKNTRQLYNTMDYLDQEDEANTSSTGTGVNLMRMMTHFFETCEDNVICSAIVDGFCRLILHGHCTSQDIMSKLLLKYFNPTTEPKTQQILGIFFECLIKKKRQEILQKALLHTLFTILEAPNDSPLQEVKPEHVVKFVIDSTKPVFCSPGLNPHNTIAISFLQIMLDNLNYKDLLKLLSKELLTLEISDDAVLKNDIIHCIDQILQEQTLDPKIVKNLNDFKEMLHGTYRESLTFSSSRAPPAAAPEEHDPDHLSDPDEPPEVALDEEEQPKDPKEVPQINKSSLQKDDSVLTQSSPAKPATEPTPASPIVPQTPTTFGTDNASGMKSLRKSMNVSDRNVSRNVFKVPDANATKKLHQKKQKAIAQKSKPDDESETGGSDESPESPESEEADTAMEESFAIPSTQDISGVSTIDGDSSILHLEIPETQQPMEGHSTPTQRTPSKRKISHGSTEEEDDDVVDTSPNVVTNRRDRSMIIPAVSAKSMAKSFSAAKAEQPRTRHTARKEIINAKVMTRKSLTDVTTASRGSKRGSLTGIEPLEPSPPARRKNRSSASDESGTSKKIDDKLTPSAAKTKRLETSNEKNDSAEKSASKERTNKSKKSDDNSKESEERPKQSLQKSKASAEKSKELAEKSKKSNKKSKDSTEKLTESAEKSKEPSETALSKNKTSTTKKADKTRTDSPALRTSRRNLNKGETTAPSSSKKDSEKEPTAKKDPQDKRKSVPERVSTRKSLEKPKTPSSEKPEKTSTRSASKAVPPSASEKSSSTRQKAAQGSPSTSTPTNKSQSGTTKNQVKRTIATRRSKGSISSSPAATLSVSSVGSQDSSTSTSPVRNKRVAVTPLSGESAITTRSTSTPTRPARKAAKK
ncbi:condensin complex subunit 3 [Armigeres subalbatus]|uniref:condensin complex subunit 3 n=1 Tax=Armigeres subalbatus TaxID=124917 RepID=UPI002ED5813C